MTKRTAFRQIILETRARFLAILANTLFSREKKFLGHVVSRLLVSGKGTVNDDPEFDHSRSDVDR